MFVKTFKNYTSAEVEILVKHSREIYDVLKDQENIIFPEVLAHGANSITYSTVDCRLPMLDKVKSFSCTSSEMLRIGRILKVMHTTGILHSDFVPHNFFYSPSGLVLIDPHPPENMDFNIERLYGLHQNEVVNFIFCMLTDAGLKASLFHFSYQSHLVDAFLVGYGKENLSFKKTILPVLRHGKDIYIQRKRTGFSLIHNILHCTIGVIFTYIILWNCL